MTNLGNGHSPFWLDNDTYGFLREGNSAIFLADLNESDPEVLLSIEELIPELPENRQSLRLAIRQVFSEPAIPDTLFVLASHGLVGDSLLFRLSLEADGAGNRQLPLDISLLLDDLLILAPEPFGLISPDGRLLASGTSRGDFILYELATGEERLVGKTGERFSLSSHDWSADAPWTAYVGNRYVELLAPLPNGELFRRIIFHDDLHCSAAVWVNKLD